jgi:uncharacterized membrane protein YbhN (UPF0104 family)
MAIVKFGLKLGVTLVTFYVVARALSLEQIIVIVTGAKAGWLALAVALFVLTQVVSAQRHFFVIRRLGEHIGLGRATEVHFIGLWFNQVLPSSVGGDIVKIMLLRDRLGTGLAIRSVIIDRLSGLMMMFLSILLLTPWYAQIFDSSWIAAGLGVSSFAALAFVFAVAGWLKSKPGLLVRIPRAAPVVDLFNDIWLFRRGPALRQQLWTSLFIHLGGVFAYAFLGRGLNVEASWMAYLLLTPLLFLVTLVPVSLAGWGVRELGAVWLFGFAGIAPESALLISVLFGLLLIVTALPGGCLLLLSGQLFRRRPEEATKSQLVGQGPGDR